MGRLNASSLKITASLHKIQLTVLDGAHELVGAVCARMKLECVPGDPAAPVNNNIDEYHDHFDEIKFDVCDNATTTTTTKTNVTFECADLKSGAFYHLRLVVSKNGWHSKAVHTSALWTELSPPVITNLTFDASGLRLNLCFEHAGEADRHDLLWTTSNDGADFRPHVDFVKEGLKAFTSYESLELHDLNYGTVYSFQVRSVGCRSHCSSSSPVVRAYTSVDGAKIRKASDYLLGIQLNSFNLRFNEAKGPRLPYDDIFIVCEKLGSTKFVEENECRANSSKISCWCSHLEPATAYAIKLATVKRGFKLHDERYSTSWNNLTLNGTFFTSKRSARTNYNLIK